MNANELADVMKKYSVAGFQYPLCDEFKQAATMIRQQQERLIKYELRHAEQRKRIDELEAYQKHDVELAEAIGWDKGYEAGRQLGMKQEQALWELAASTQEIMDTHQYERPHNTVLVPCDKLAEMQAEIEALKAHPVKEQLTDEEIMEVYKEVSEPFGEKRLYEIHDFARAILRKAQEK